MRWNTLGLGTNRDASMLAEQEWEKNHSIKILARSSFEEIMTEGLEFYDPFLIEVKSMTLCSAMEDALWIPDTDTQH